MPTGSKLRLGVKAVLLNCPEKGVLKDFCLPVVDGVILDGEVVVEVLNPGLLKTFQKYGDTVFILYVSAQLEKTKLKRGKGSRKRVASFTLVEKKAGKIS